MRLRLRHHRRFILFVAISATIIFSLLIFQKTRPVEVVINDVRGSLAWTGNSVGAAIEHIFYSRSELIKENQTLKEALQDLALNAAGVASLQDENAALAALLSYHQRVGTPPVIAKVVSRSDDIDGEAIFIDRGSTDGVGLGEAVIADDGLLIGEVVSLRQSSAIVRLVTDEASKIGVRVLNEDNTIGIAEGQNGQLLRIDFIPQAIDLNINEVVTTSGLDPGIPSGLVLGTIEEVIRDEHSPFQQALVKPLIDIRRLSLVGIVKL